MTTLFKKDKLGRTRVVELNVVKKSKDYTLVSTTFIEGSNSKRTVVLKQFDKIPKKFNNAEDYCKYLIDKETQSRTKKGFAKDRNALTSHNKFPGGEPMPMLLNKIDTLDLEDSTVLKEAFAKYPYLYLQPKIYGERCIAYNDKTPKLISRGYEFYDIDHIYEQIASIFNDVTFSLDGEIVVINWELGDIRSLINNKTAHERSKLAYVIYDVPIENLDFDVRLNLLNSVDVSKCPNIIICPTVKVKTVEELKLMHKRFFGMYGEGSVLRLPDSKYEFGFRSNATLKIKPRMDEEFLCLSYYQRKNENSITLILETEDKKTFSAKLKGNAERIKKAIESFNDEFENKLVTVEFMKYSKHGIPLEPVAIGPRPDRDR